MRVIARVIFLATIVASSPVLAQQWLDYVNREYRFAVNFPVEPAEQDTAYTSADGTAVAAHTFFAERDTSRYRVTVVTFPAEIADVAAEISHATALHRPRGVAQHDGRGDYDGVPAHDLNMIGPAGRQIVVSILYHDRRLYIVEGDVSADAAPPIQFQQSIVVIDADGTPVNLER